MKKLLIVMVLILCAGCTNIKYSFNFEKKDLSEKIDVYDKNQVEYNKPGDIHISDMSAFEFLFQSLPYDSTGDGRGNYSASKKYKSIDEYLDHSIIFSKFIDVNDIIVNGSKVDIDITCNDNMRKSITDMEIESLSISLDIPYYVSNHNANSVVNNTYTWEFKNIEKAHIKLSFDMSKSFKFKENMLTIVAVGILCAIIVGIIIYFASKNKKVNEI